MRGSASVFERVTVTRALPSKRHVHGPPALGGVRRFCPARGTRAGKVRGGADRGEAIRREPRRLAFNVAARVRVDVRQPLHGAPDAFGAGGGGVARAAVAVADRGAVKPDGGERPGFGAHGQIGPDRDGIGGKRVQSLPGAPCGEAVPRLAVVAAGGRALGGLHGFGDPLHVLRSERGGVAFRAGDGG